MQPELPDRSPRLVRASLSLMTSDVSAAIGYFAFVLLVARLAGPTHRGTVAFVTTVPVLLAYGATLGIDAANLFYSGKKPEMRSTLVIGSIGVGLFSGLSFSLLAWLLFSWQDGWVPEQVPPELLIVGLASTALITVQIALDSALIGSGQVGWANGIRVSIPSVSLVALLVLGMSIGRFDATVATFAWFAGRLVGFVFAVAVAIVRIGLGRSGKMLRSLGDLFGYGIPAHIGALADLPIRRLDVLILGATRGSTDLGIYTAAVNGAEILMYLPTAVSAVLLPAGSGRSEAEARTLTRRALIAVIAGSALVAAAVILLAPWMVVLLFGPEFADSALPLRILMIAMVGTAIRMILRSGLMMRRRQGLASVMTVVTLAVIVALDLWLIPRFGVLGAAWASVVAYWFGALLMYAAFRRVLPPDDAHSIRADIGAAWRVVVEMLRRAPR